LVVLVGLVPTASAAGATDELSPLPIQPGSLQAQLLETIARPTSVASYGGWASWSRYDSTHRAYQLIVRNANGEVTAMGVAESPQPFEASLGPLASGWVGAVYPRSSDTVRHEGCSLELLAIEGARAAA